MSINFLKNKKFIVRAIYPSGTLTIVSIRIELKKTNKNIFNNNKFFTKKLFNYKFKICLF